MIEYEKLIKNNYLNKIFAHTSKHDSKETLTEHAKLTQEYCRVIIKTLNIEKIISNISEQLMVDKKELLNVIENIIYHHDLGKINPKFQEEKMNNKIINYSNIHCSNHSFYGTILFQQLFYEEFEKRIKKSDEMDKLLSLFILLTLTIDRHHSNLKNIDYLGEEISNGKKDRELNDINEFKKILNKEIDIHQKGSLANKYYFINHPHFDNGSLNEFFKSATEKEALFYLFKLVYSLLITSDYYATMDFKKNISYKNNLKIINSELRKKIMHNFFNRGMDYNKNLENKKYLIDKKVSEIDDINELRTKILLEADKKLREEYNKGKKIFYLNVPTGGGKTNISLKLAISLLELNKNIKRIFYVFPYINIIEQNYEFIKKALDLDDEISPVYSTSGWKLNKQDDEEIKYVLDCEFLNFPIIIMSNVNFFNSFIKSSKRNNFQFHNLSNSIVILDEIQSLNDEDWTLFSDLIRFSSKFLNIHYIIMSATLPKLDEIELNINREEHELNYFSELLDKARDYYEHPIFKNRVSIEYLENIKSIDELVGFVKEEITKNEYNKTLIVLNTVKDSRNTYKKLKELKEFKGFEVYLLNSTILPHRRRYIISKFSEESSKKLILVSTQSIEAGVDIDCDFGIRDFAIFDSIEQVAGRINRESRKQGRLVIVKLNDDNGCEIFSKVYKKTCRGRLIQEYSPNEVRKFLKERDFQFSDNSFYKKLVDYINNENSNKIKKSSIDYVKSLRKLYFDDLNGISVIDEDSITLIVDIPISIELEISGKPFFSKAEKEFLHNFKLIDKNKEVRGGRVLEEYNNFINDKGDLVSRKIKNKKWVSILSKFSISINKNYLREKFGIPLLKEYDVEQGLDVDDLDKNVVWIR